MNSADMLRSAADCIEVSGVSEKQELILRVIAVHIKDVVGSGITDRCEQTRCLIKLLDQSK